MGRLTGKIAIITGGTRGIGKAIVARFAEEDAKVVTVARNVSDGEEGISADGPSLLRADVSREDDVKALFRRTLDTFGRLDVLVNNAAILLPKTIEDTTEAEWDELMAINLKGPFLTSKHALVPMRAAGGGSIINIGSYDGLVADPALAIYGASKGGVHALSRAIAVDHGADGIRCNVICPGWIRTEMMEEYLAEQPEGRESEKLAIAQHPVGRLGRPEDIANLALWLASDEAAFATGQLLIHDGGLTAHAPYVG